MRKNNPYGLVIKNIGGFMKKGICFGIPGKLQNSVSYSGGRGKIGVLPLVLSCAVLLLVFGCTTTITAPLVYTNNENARFQILGEVQYRKKLNAIILKLFSKYINK
jgi:hypothetical protein